VKRENCGNLVKNEQSFVFAVGKWYFSVKLSQIFCKFETTTSTKRNLKMGNKWQKNENKFWDTPTKIYAVLTAVLFVIAILIFASTGQSNTPVQIVVSFLVFFLGAFISKVIDNRKERKADVFCQFQNELYDIGVLKIYSSRTGDRSSYRDDLLKDFSKLNIKTSVRRNAYKNNRNSIRNVFWNS